MALTTIVLLGILAYSALFGTAWLDPPDAVSLKNWDKIRVGMTEAEVVAIFGTPGTIPPPNFTDDLDDEGILRWFPARIWHGENGEVRLWIVHVSGVQPQVLGGYFIPRNGGPRIRVQVRPTEREMWHRIRRAMSI
jgi:hypothetical protein